MNVLDLSDFEDQDDEEMDEALTKDEGDDADWMDNLYTEGLMIDDRLNECSLRFSRDCYFGFPLGDGTSDFADDTEDSGSTQDGDIDALATEEHDRIVDTMIGF